MFQEGRFGSMRLPMFAAAMLVATGALLLPQIIGQVIPDSIKHITTAPANGAIRGDATLAAMDIERGPYPSVVRLKRGRWKSG